MNRWPFAWAIVLTTCLVTMPAPIDAGDGTGSELPHSLLTTGRSRWTTSTPSTRYWRQTPSQPMHSTVAW